MNIFKGIPFINIFIIIFMFFNENNCTSNQFLSASTTVKTFENDTVQLPCQYNKSPIQYIKWYRSEVEIADTRNPMHVGMKNIRIWNNGSLEVSHIQPNDVGDYLCEVITTDGRTLHQEHTIQIQYPPTVVSSLSGTIETKIGKIFELTCEATGIPQPVIKWRQNGEYINETMENSHILVVEVTDRDMTGPIECIAVNGVGQPAIAGIYLIVQFPPVISPISRMVHTKLYAPAILECSMDSMPMGTMQWLHNGIPVINDGHIQTHTRDLKNTNKMHGQITNMIHTLIIKSVRENDFGSYECRGENKLGYKSAIIELSGRPLPSIFKPSSQLQGPTSYTLIWRTESLSPIIEYKLRFRQMLMADTSPEWNELVIPGDTSDGPIHNTGYTLSGLQQHTRYEVTVISRNIYGWSESSKVIRFQSGGEIESTELLITTELYEYTEPQFNEEENTISDTLVNSTSRCQISIAFIFLLIHHLYQLIYNIGVIF